MAEAIPIEVVNLQIIHKWQELLKKSRKLGGNDDFYAAKRQLLDSCDASMGKIIMKYYQNFDLKDLYLKWLKHLPIKSHHYQE